MKTFEELSPFLIWECKGMSLILPTKFFRNFFKAILKKVSKREVFFVKELPLFLFADGKDNGKWFISKLF
jgi:hypothetical protein